MTIGCLRYPNLIGLQKHFETDKTWWADWLVDVKLLRLLTNPQSYPTQENFLEAKNVILVAFSRSNDGLVAWDRSYIPVRNSLRETEPNQLFTNTRCCGLIGRCVSPIFPTWSGTWDMMVMLPDWWMLDWYFTHLSNGLDGAVWCNIQVGRRNRFYFRFMYPFAAVECAVCGACLRAVDLLLCPIYCLQYIELRTHTREVLSLLVASLYRVASSCLLLIGAIPNPNPVVWHRLL